MINSPRSTVRKSSIFIKNFQFPPTADYQGKTPNHIPSQLELKQQIEKRMLSKYDFSLEAFYRMKINQILNHHSIPYARYKERLIEIDINEFLKQEYSTEEINAKLKLIILILSFLIKEYPNYTSLFNVYQIMQINMMQKQKLINNNYHLLIEEYRKKANINIGNVNNIFDSDFFNESQQDDDSKYYAPIFFTDKMNKSDSIGSVENLVKYIYNVEKGYDDIGNGLLKTPTIRSKKNKKRRIGAMFSIIKKMTSYDLNGSNIDVFNLNPNYHSEKIKYNPKCISNLDNKNAIKEDENDLVNSFEDNSNSNNANTNSLKAIHLLQVRIKKTKTNSYLTDHNRQKLLERSPFKKNRLISERKENNKRNSILTISNSNNSLNNNLSRSISHNNSNNINSNKSNTISSINNNISSNSPSRIRYSNFRKSLENNYKTINNTPSINKFAKTSAFIEKMRNKHKKYKNFSLSHEKLYLDNYKKEDKNYETSDTNGNTISPKKKIGLFFSNTNQKTNLLKIFLTRKMIEKDHNFPPLFSHSKNSKSDIINSITSAKKFKVVKNKPGQIVSPMTSPVVPKVKGENNKYIFQSPGDFSRSKCFYTLSSFNSNIKPSQLTHSYTKKVKQKNNSKKVLEDCSQSYNMGYNIINNKMKKIRHLNLNANK